jgi:hypothetical protein
MRNRDDAIIAATVSKNWIGLSRVPERRTMGIESEGVSTQEADIAVIGGHKRPPTADEMRFGVDRRAGRR